MSSSCADFFAASFWSISISVTVIVGSESGDGTSPGQPAGRRRSASSSALPGDGGAERGRISVELFARVQLGDGDEEIALASFVEIAERNAAEDLLVLEIGEDVLRRERRAHDEL